MKKLYVPIISLVCFMLCMQSSSAQIPNTWTQKADFGGAFSQFSVGFSIGNKGYIGTGQIGSNYYSSDFWEYDPLSDTWTQKANFGGAERNYAVGFSIGNKGYIGTGSTISGSANDFWEYDPSANAWTQKANFGGAARTGAVGFSIGAKGYIGTGSTASGFANDFWEFDPSVNTWTLKANFGGTGRQGATGFSIGAKGYIGTGWDGNLKNDFWEYNPSSNTWSQKAIFGGTGREGASGFGIGAKGYIGTGWDGDLKNDFWEYNPATNTWTLKAVFSGTGRDFAGSFSIGTYGFIGTGEQYGGPSNDCWEYTPSCILPASPVNTTPAANLTICSGLTTALSASGTGTLGWYNALVGGSWLGGGTNFTTPVLTVSTTFYVQDSTCGASPVRTGIPVNVNPVPAAVAGANRAICMNAGTQIGAAPVAGNTYSWISVPAGYTSTTANPVVTPLVTTTYTLTETITATGCSKSNSVVITVNPLPAAVAGANRSVCQNSGTQIGAAPVSGHTYSWTSVPAGFTSTLANPTVTPLVTTTYILTETITSTGCANSNSVVVTVNPSPAAYAGANRAICLSASTQIGAAPVAGNTYSWTSVPAGFTSTVSNPVVTPLVTTTYTLTETITATGCSNINSVVVTVNPLPAANAGVNRDICMNSGTQIGASAVAGHTYIWTSVPAGFTSTVSNPVVTPLTTTTYTLTETITATGCINSNSVVVTVNPLPSAFAGANSTICQNTSTQLGTAPVTGSTYSWTSVPSGYTSSLANPLVTPMITTTYTLTETITATACSNSNSVMVTVNPAPAANAGANRAICLNASTQIGSDPVAGNIYSWTSVPAGFTSIISNPIVTPLVTTTYTLTETNLITGCQNTNSVIVTVNPLPAAVAGLNRSICQNTSTQLGSAPATGHTYNWTSVPAGFVSTISNPVVTPMVTTTYTLVETVTATGCTNSHSVIVTVNPSPAANAGTNRAICLNASTQIGSNPVAGNTYSWTSVPAGFISGIANPIVTPLLTTTYTLAETITLTGCTNSNSVVVTVNPLPVANAGANRSICQNAVTQLGAAPVTGNTYSWTSVPPGFNSTLSNPVVSPLVNTTYTLTETNTATACTNTNSVVVTVNPTPAAIAGANRAICLHDSTQIGAVAVAGNTYSWTSIPPGFISTLANPFVTPQLTTTYTLTETITATGCTSTNSVVITVNPIPAATAGANRAICLNSSTQIGSAAIPGHTYSWTSLPAGFTSTSSNPTVTPLLTTIYTLTETITATGCTNANSVVVTVNPIPAAIAGANRAICLHDSTQIGSAPVPGSIYNWTSVPAGFISTLANPIVTPLLTTTYILTEIITATGCTNTNSLLVTVHPLPSPTLSGPSAICEGVPGITYSTQTGMGNYQWNISQGGTIQSGLGTASVQVRWDSAGARFITVNYSNSYGCFALTPAVKNVTVYSLPLPTITGPDSLCLNTTGTYITESGMSNYQWIISPGGSTVTGLGTNTIHVTWTSSGPRFVSVNYTNTNNCYAANPSIYNVEVFPLPVPTITGSGSVCANTSGVTYFTESGMSNYTWSVSTGGTITSGQGTDSIAVTWGSAGSGVVSVSYTSDMGCNPLNPSTKTVTIFPRPVPTISGSSSVCINSGPKTYFTEAGQQNYTWNISPGDTIQSGPGTSSVTVHWSNSGNRWISVTYSSPAGCQAIEPDTLLVTVTPLPGAASAITGPSFLCVPAFWQEYSIDSVVNAGGYYWTLPAGAIFQGTSNSNIVHVAYLQNAQSGDITVYGTNVCGNGAASSLSVTLHPVPAKPVISLKQNDTLVSSSSYGNQWYFNNQLLQGDTLDHLHAALTGDYYSIVTLGNCSSDTSNVMFVIAVGLKEDPKFNVSIHPNPTSGRITLDFISPGDKIYKVMLISELGHILFESEKTITNGKYSWCIDLGDLAPGPVFLVIQSPDGIIRKKIIKN